MHAWVPEQLKTALSTSRSCKRRRHLHPLAWQRLQNHLCTEHRPVVHTHFNAEAAAAQAAGARALKAASSHCKARNGGSWVGQKSVGSLADLGLHSFCPSASCICLPLGRSQPLALFWRWPALSGRFEGGALHTSANEDRARAPVGSCTGKRSPEAPCHTGDKGCAD